MHPVNSKLHNNKIDRQIDKVVCPTDITYPRKAFSPSMFNHVFTDRWKNSIPWHSFHCNSYLQKHCFVRRNRICNKNSLPVKKPNGVHPQTQIKEYIYCTMPILEIMIHNKKCKGPIVHIATVLEIGYFDICNKSPLNISRGPPYTRSSNNSWNQ